MPAKKSAGARFEPASDQSLLVYFGEQITLEANENVRRLLHLLEQEPIPGVDNLHPAYCSLLVKFAALKWRHQELERQLRKYLGRLNNVRLPEPRLVEIPVCYGREDGDCWGARRWPCLGPIETVSGFSPSAIALDLCRFRGIGSRSSNAYEGH